jgi:NAD(P)-dependent dehydrogenase (short-subunit alcohol dehydrogenase family)
MPTVLITGGQKGVGLQASRTIAGLGGNDLLIGGRDMAEIERVAASLKREFGTNVRALEVDVSSLASVRKAAAAVKKLVAKGDISPLGALLLNAGAQFRGPPRYSADGYELTFATNCLGHFLLMNLLLDAISADGRIIFTASGTHDPATTDGKIVGAAVEPDAVALANQGKSGPLISGGRRYTTSKLCTILYAYELDRRLRAAGSSILSVAYDPGMIPETGLTASIPRPAKALLRSMLMKRVLKALGVTIGNLKFSGEMLGRLAIASDYANASGKFMQSRNCKSVEQRSSDTSYDSERAKKMWSDSEKLVGLSPTERPRVIK